MANAKKDALTSSEITLLGQAWACAKSGANFRTNIDYEKLAQMAGHTNPMSTRNAIGRIEAKLLKFAEPPSPGQAKDSGATAGTPPKKRAAGANKRKQFDDDAGGEDNECVKPKAPNAKPSAAKNKETAAPGNKKKQKTATTSINVEEHARAARQTRSRSGSEDPIPNADKNRFTPANGKFDVRANTKSRRTMQPIKEEDSDDEY